MAGLIGAGAGLALLYFWLAGNWFARALVFLWFAGTSILLCDDKQYGLYILIAGFGGGWIIASAPTWFYQRKEARRDKSETFAIPYPR